MHVVFPLKSTAIKSPHKFAQQRQMIFVWWIGQGNVDQSGFLYHAFLVCKRVKAGLSVVLSHAAFPHTAEMQMRV